MLLITKTMNLPKIFKAVGKFFNFLKRHEEDLQAVIDIVNAIKEALHKKEPAMLSTVMPKQLPLFKQSRFLALLKEVLIYLRLCKSEVVTLPQALENIRKIDKQALPIVWNDIAGNLLARKTGMDITAAKVQVEAAYQAYKATNAGA